jgi:SPOR domain
MNLPRVNILGLFLVALLCVPGHAFAQRFTSGATQHPVQPADTLADENGRLAYEALEAGKVDEARDYLDDANPQGPYAAFVRAALTKDAITAANMYKEIVAEYRGKAIAREALIRLYKYHYAAGDYSSAHRDYVELKKFSPPAQLPDPLGLKDSLQLLPAPPDTQSEAAAETVEDSPVAPPTYLVQVGVFTTADNARRFIQNLKMYGITGTLFTKDDGGRTLYGVSAGSFSDRAAAEDMVANLKGRSIDCMVVQK